jgi:membrane associated rhomboid family serine protease
MRRPPSWSEFGRFPVVTSTVVLATAVSVLEWNGRDLSFLTVDPRVGRGEVWRFLTSAFPHVDVLHLIFNVYWTWTLGTLVESVFGHARTVATFALLAVVSSAAEYALFRGGVGLSGVGYGLFGMLWVLDRRDPRFEGAIDAGTVGLFVGWFFLCIVLTVTGTMAVANVAHAAGAATGLALGWAVVRRGAARTVAAVGVALLAAASLLGATVGRSHVNRSPDRGDAEARLGYEALRAGRNEEALRWLSEATRLAPDEAGSWFNLGLAYQRLSKVDQARDAYERAHRLRPDEPDYRAAVESTR